MVGILEPVPLAPEIDRSAMIGYPAAATYLDADRSPSTDLRPRRTGRGDDVREVLGATANPEHPEEVDGQPAVRRHRGEGRGRDAFTGLFLGLGAVALLVGGLGIANVMLMAVLERRPEIGLRRALGATRRHIAGQFLTEAVLLAALGGLLGVVVGAAVGAGYARSQGWGIVIPIVGVAGGVLVAVVIGAIAGLYPALRAAAVPPTEALRSG